MSRTLWQRMKDCPGEWAKYADDIRAFLLVGLAVALTGLVLLYIALSMLGQQAVRLP